MENRNLWEAVGILCLKKAKTMLQEVALLDYDHNPSGVAEVVDKLVDIAIRIDALNLSWEAQTRYSILDPSDMQNHLLPKERN